jgi:signal transduction histidine kinase
MKAEKWFGLTLILTMLLTSVATAQIQPDTLYVKDSAAYSLNEHLYYYKTPEKKSFNEVSTLLHTNAFKKLYPDNAINAGVTTNYYWLTFTLKNMQATDGVFYFQLHQPWLNEVRLYAKTDTGFVLMGQSGLQLKFNARPYPYYDMLFPIHLRSGGAGAYIAVIDNIGASLNILPALTGENEFKAQEKKEYLLFGVLTGVMIFNLLVNIFLYFALKEKIHRLYFLYVLSMLYWMYCNTALDFQYFYPDYPFIATISEYFAGSAACVTMANLISGFLGVTRKNSRFKVPMTLLKYGFMVLPFLSIVVYKWLDDVIWAKEMYVYIFIGAAIVLSVLFYAITIEKIIQKVKLGWFYLMGGFYIGYAIIKYCVFLLGGSHNTTVQTAPNDVQIGLVIEAVIIFIGIIYRYNTYKNDKEQLLLQLNKQQKETMQQIITAQEEERKRIAQDIHDDVGSTLGSLLLHISNIPGKQNQQDVEYSSHYQKSIAIGQKAISDLRAISHDLLPRDFTELGIFHVLQNRVDELNMIGNIRFTLITEGEDKGIEPIFAITIYRIINELINNVLKHSQASLATVQLLMTRTEIIVMLEDNGVGMANKSGKGIGLKNVLSRTEFLHGTINIDDNAAGTSVIIEIPVENNHLKNRDEH